MTQKEYNQTIIKERKVKHLQNGSSSLEKTKSNLFNDTSAFKFLEFLLQNILIRFCCYVLKFLLIQ